MEYDYQKIKKQIQAESDIQTRFGPGKIWDFLLQEIFKNDTRKAIQFMLSPEGGFSLSDIKKIEQRKRASREYYNKNQQTELELVNF